MTRCGHTIVRSRTDGGRNYSHISLEDETEKCGLTASWSQIVEGNLRSVKRFEAGSLINDLGNPDLGCKRTVLFCKVATRALGHDSGIADKPRRQFDHRILDVLIGHFESVAIELRIESEAGGEVGMSASLGEPLAAGSRGDRREATWLNSKGAKRGGCRNSPGQEANERDEQRRDVAFAVDDHLFSLLAADLGEGAGYFSLGDHFERSWSALIRVTWRLGVCLPPWW